MSYKHVGPIGWEFSGDKTRCFQLIGPARLLAQQALEKIQARGGRGQQMERRRLADGSTIRVQVVWNFQTPLVRGYINSPVAKLENVIFAYFESGLLALSETLPISIYYGTTLKEQFGSNRWQGAYIRHNDECPLWKAFDGASPYTSKVYADEASLSVVSGLAVSPAQFTGKMRLLVQGKLGAARNPNELLPSGGGFLTSLDGRFHGLAQDPNGAYWLCALGTNIGLRMVRLAVDSECLPAEQTSALPEAFILSTATPAILSVADGIAIYDEVQVIPSSEIQAITGFPLGHQWHWSRNSNRAACVFIESGEVAGLDCWVGTLHVVDVTWEIVDKQYRPRGAISIEETGSPVRNFHGFSPLWYPVPGAEVYSTWITDPPYALQAFYDPFLGNVSPLYVWFDDTDDLIVLRYHQYASESVAESGVAQSPCPSGQNKSVVGFSGTLSGGFSVAGISMYGGLLYETGLITERSASLSGGGKNYTYESTNVADHFKFHVISGFGPDLTDPCIDIMSAPDWPFGYHSFRWTASGAGFFQKETKHYNKEEEYKRCCVIPYHDAECVLFFENHAIAASSEVEKQIFIESLAPGGEASTVGNYTLQLWSRAEDGTRGALVLDLSGSANKNTGMGDGCGGGGSADTGFVPNFFPDEFSDQIEDSAVTIENPKWGSGGGSFICSTGVDVFISGEGAFGSFLYPSPTNAVLSIEIDANSAYSAGAVFSDSVFSYLTLDDYDVVPPSLGVFIGGA